ncbi:cytochrome P450 [Mammaliicoccus lentus]|uniref:Cytochrome P450 n=1 Tax=Mammaliicoccus lentus TaxID=42858 RepID=A0AAX3W4I8_MAMLE|nr:cytochrome P450 [Mammaliicoccus lentus]WHI60188.1 cytochrome P450 [Mammaliicoccus lentus]
MKIIELRHTNGIKHLREFKKNPDKFFKTYIQNDIDALKIKVFSLDYYIIISPKLIESFMKDVNNVIKPPEEIKRNSLLLGSGIINTNPPIWNSKKKKIQNTFHPSKINLFLSNDIEDIIIKEISNSKINDIDYLITKITLKIICNYLFGRGLSEQQTISINKAVQNVIDYYYNSQFNIVSKLLKRNTHKSDIKLLRTQVEYISSFDSSFIKGLKESDFSPEEIYDEIITALIVGYDSVKNSINTTLKIIYTSDSLLEDLRDDKVNLKNVIYESLRLYPPAWTISRQTQVDKYIENIKFDKYSNIIISPWITHRISFPDNPFDYDYTRWDNEDLYKKIGSVAK